MEIESTVPLPGSNGVFYFKFNNEKGCDDTLGNGPWTLIGPGISKEMGSWRGG